MTRSKADKSKFKWPEPRVATFIRLSHRHGCWAVEFKAGESLFLTTVLTDTGFTILASNSPFDSSDGWAQVCPLTLDGRRAVSSARHLLAMEADTV